MDQIDSRNRTVASSALMTLARPLQAQPKTSANWLFNFRRSEDAATGPQLVRNTAEDKLVTSYLFSNTFRSEYTTSEASQNTTGFGPKKFLVTKESSSVENFLNTLRIEDLRDRFTSELLQALRQEPVEPGVLGQADSIIAKCLNENAMATTTWLGELFIDNFNRPAVAANLLLLAGRMPYQVARPAGITMAISGLTHQNGAVQEAAIRAFENWATSDCLRILENIQVQPRWLNNYLEDVIRDLKVVCGDTR